MIAGSDCSAEEVTGDTVMMANTSQTADRKRTKPHMGTSAR
jgi:hypothetical protein